MAGLNKTGFGGQLVAADWGRWGVLALLVLLANLPNLLPWERALYPTTYWIDLQERLLKCLPLAALYFCFFRRPARAWFLLWVVCLWWMPIALAVRLFNYTPITSSLVGIALESTPGELKEFFQSLPWMFHGMFVGLNVLFFMVYRGLRQRPQLGWPLKPRLVLGLPVMTLLLMALASASPAPAPASAGSTSGGSDLFENEQSQYVSGSDLALAFPYEIAWAYAQYSQAQAIVHATIAQMRESVHTIQIGQGTTAPEIFVLVLGESSSRQDWQLFNPESLPTTPRLQARQMKDGGLLLFTNVVAQSTATRYAVPSMLSDQPLYWPDGKSNPQASRSIVHMAGKAGYATGWFSNQTSGGKHDGPLAVYAKEAQAVAFLNPSTYLQQGSYDEVLLPVLRRHLQVHERSFVVLHTLGSHFKFAHRYPPAFDQFQSDQTKSANEAGAEGQDAITSAYRNSVLYTDHVLEEVIRILEDTGRSAVMLYVSDHGQGLAEPGCPQQPINRTMARTYEVPALLWLSSAYRARQPDIVQRVARHLDAPYTTQAVYQTLVDLLEGVSDTESAHSTSPSFLHAPAPGSGQRVVSPSMRWVDFQAAANRNRCVITAPSP